MKVAIVILLCCVIGIFANPLINLPKAPQKYKDCLGEFSQETLAKASVHEKVIVNIVCMLKTEGGLNEDATLNVEHLIKMKKENVPDAKLHELAEKCNSKLDSKDKIKGYVDFQKCLDSNNIKSIIDADLYGQALAAIFEGK